MAGRPFRRSGGYIHHLFHAHQRAEGRVLYDRRIHGFDSCQYGQAGIVLSCRFHYPDAGAVLATDQCLQGDRPLGYLRFGDGFCRQRLGELYRCAAGRLFLLFGLQCQRKRAVRYLSDGSLERTGFHSRIFPRGCRYRNGICADYIEEGSQRDQDFGGSGASGGR